MGQPQWKLPVIVSPVSVNGTEILRAFGRRGAHCVAVSSSGDAEGFRSRFAHEKVILHAGPEGDEAFVEWLLSRTDLYGGLVIPTGDEIVSRLHAFRDRLSGHYKILLPPPRACEAALDKSKLARVCADAGIPTPRIIARPDTLSAAEMKDAGGLGFPVVVKPYYGIAFERAYHKRIIIVESPDKLREALDDCRSRSFDVLMQEFMPHAGTCGYSAYVTREGGVAGDYTSRRIGLYPPRAGVSFFEVAERIEPILEYGRRLVEAVGYAGAPINLDFKLDPCDGTWKLIDLNARSWRQVSLAPLVGLHVFDMILADYTGGEVPRAESIRYGRHWLYLKDALRVWHSYPGEGPSMRDYAAMFRSRFTIGLFDLFDPRPFLADLAPLVLRRFRHAGTPPPEEPPIRI